MGLAIDVDEVTAVLLTDGWHMVADKSFTLDAYEFLYYGSEERKRNHDYIALTSHPSSPSGFGFKEASGDTTGWIYGPITAILAVRTEA